MSTLSRRDYFINLRKSYHVRLNALSTSETLIFLPNESDKTCGNVLNLIQLKSLIEVDLDKIDLLLSKLEDKLEQYKFGLPTLLISGEQEIYNQAKTEIDSVTELCLKIRDHLEASFHKQTKGNPPSSPPVDQLKSNIGAHLANRLTEQFEKFQVFQKMFNSILYERIKNTKKPIITETNSNCSPNTEMCLVLDEEQETMLQERSQEIDQVLSDTLHINDILNQIQVMTVQQGSLFDRIDVNLDRTRQNLGKTVQRLEKTAESFSVHQKRLILFFITLAIFVTSLLILYK